MKQRNWLRPEDYAYTEVLEAGQWAWEFLRRNSGYQKDWQWFYDRWQTLESRYGKPPERDFQRWKKDPLAYRKMEDADGDCQVEQDNVLGQEIPQEEATTLLSETEALVNGGYREILRLPGRRQLQVR